MTGYVSDFDDMLPDDEDDSVLAFLVGGCLVDMNLFRMKDTLFVVVLSVVAIPSRDIVVLCAVVRGAGVSLGSTRYLVLMAVLCIFRI